jgi:hypothetical protein
MMLTFKFYVKANEHFPSIVDIAGCMISSPVAMYGLYMEWTYMPAF